MRTVETASIDGITLHLAAPDELDLPWAGSEDLKTQLLAAWMIK